LLTRKSVTYNGSRRTGQRVAIDVALTTRLKLTSSPVESAAFPLRVLREHQVQVEKDVQN
jgi:hypothetical protein